MITRASACGFIICWYSLQEWISVSSAWSAPSFEIQKWKYSFIKFTQITKVGGNDWDWSSYLRFHNFNIKKNIIKIRELKESSIFMLSDLWNTQSQHTGISTFMVNVIGLDHIFRKFNLLQWKSREIYQMSGVGSERPVLRFRLISSSSWAIKFICMRHIFHLQFKEKVCLEKYLTKYSVSALNRFK